MAQRALAFVCAALLAPPSSAYTCDNALIDPEPAPEKAGAFAAYGHGHGLRVHDHHHHDGALPLPSAPAASAAARAYAARRASAAAPPALAAERLPLSSVKLLDGGRGALGQSNTLAWLQLFDAERLLFSFRATANLSTNGAQSYGGWESPGSLLRGHVTGGHFLSAAAQMVNSTGDAALAKTLAYLVGELQACQAANAALFGAGYLSAYPPDQFTCLENDMQGCHIWAPYYTVAKIMRGLYDVYALVGDARAAAVAQGMMSYFAGRIRAFIARSTVSAWHPLLNAEFGGMNDVAWLFYQATGSADALYLAGAFDKACLLGPMALGEDYLAGIHANTHIPVVVGAAQGFEATGFAPFELATKGYFDAVHSGHTFVTGGASTGEWWGDAHRLGDGLDVNAVESCTSYNTLKISRALFSWSLDAGFLDSYERLKFSGMFGTMHPTAPGRILYMLPIDSTGVSKAHSYYGWSDPTDSMWCCSGSGMESGSKHGELLFMAQAGGAALLVTLYDDAAVTWPVPGGGGAVATVTQRPVYSSSALSVSVSVSVSAPATFALALRIPGWAVGASAAVNGNAVAASGAWFNVSRAWAAAGDVVTATFPFVPMLEALDDDRAEFAKHRAVTAGPFALAAFTRTDNVIVGINSTAASPPWVRPVTADERARSFSLSAPSFPNGAGAFVRHDNGTGIVVAVLDLPTAPCKDCPVTFKLQPPGFIGAGNDIASGNWTLAEAEAQCAANMACVAFTFHSANPDPAGTVPVMLKSAADFSSADGWTSYTSSRVGNPLGGDEDGPTSVWILDEARLGGAAGQVSVRSFDRPGEFLSCEPSPALCLLAHGASPGFNASASFIVHSPGLSGAAGSVSLESRLVPGAYVSYWGFTGASQASLQVVPLVPGSGFANASSFAQAAPVWRAPPVLFVAETGDDTVPNSRHLLLMPMADFVSEWYATYLIVG